MLEILARSVRLHYIKFKRPPEVTIHGLTTYERMRQNCSSGSRSRPSKKRAGGKTDHMVLHIIRQFFFKFLTKGCTYSCHYWQRKTCLEINTRTLGRLLSARVVYVTRFSRFGSRTCLGLGGGGGHTHLHQDS
jgi:hypothetical protein